MHLALGYRSSDTIHDLISLMAKAIDHDKVCPMMHAHAYFQLDS